MRTRWIRVRHAVTGGETDIPARSLESYMRRGWHPASAEFKAGDPAEPESAVEVDEDTYEENQ